MTLPHGWKTLPLSEVAEVRLGRQRSPDRATGPNMVPYLRAANVTWAGIDVTDLKEMDFTPKEQEVYRLLPGDILLSEASGSASEVGKPALWRSEVPGACFQNTLIRVRSKGPLPEFLCYQFLNDARAGRFAVAGKGVGINHLGADRMSSWPVVVPSLDVQRRIVAKLDDLLAQSRAAREQLEAVPGLVEKYRQSVLAAAFRGDLTADWRKKNPDVEPASKLLERIRVERRKAWEAAELAKMKAKGKVPKDDKWKAKYEDPEPVDVGGRDALPRGWAWATWEQVGDSQNGRPFPSADYCTAGVKLLRPGNLHVSGEVRWTDDNTKCMPVHYERENESWVVGPNELVMNLTAQSLKDEFLGRVCLTGTGEHCLLNQRIARLTPHIVSPKFVMWLMKTPLFRRFVDGLNSGTLIQHMFTSQLAKWVFPMPPEAEQAVIVKVVEEHAARWRLVPDASHEVVTRTSELDRALLAKAFSGELVS